MNEAALKARLQELDGEAEKVTKDYAGDRIDRKQFLEAATNINAEVESTKKALANLAAGKKAFAAAEAAAMEGTFDPPSIDPVDVDAEWVNPRWIAPVSPMDITQAQMKQLWDCFAENRPCSITVKQKSMVSGTGQPATLADWKAGISAKSAVFESNIGGGFSGQLPPVQSPYAVGLGYEPTRISSLLPGAAMPGPSATYMVHTGNASATTGVAEGGTKGDIGAEFANYQVKPQKIAGLASLTLEAWQDTESYGPARFSAWLPQELTRDLINSESVWLLQASTASSNPISGAPTNSTFNGLLNTAGTLTRDAGTDAPFDVMSQAFNDIRVGPAYAWPDLVLMHPTTWNAMRRIKDDQGRYILDLLSAPLSLTADGSPRIAAPADGPNSFSIVPQGSPAMAGNLWGVPVALSTHCAEGTAIVMSIRAGGGIFWNRLGMRIEFNPWGDTEWTTNTYSWRAEMRVCLSVPRPSALNLVTGLPTS